MNDQQSEGWKRRLHCPHCVHPVELTVEIDTGHSELYGTYGGASVKLACPSCNEVFFDDKFY